MAVKTKAIHMDDPFAKLGTEKYENLLIYLNTVTLCLKNITPPNALNFKRVLLLMFSFKNMMHLEQYWWANDSLRITLVSTEELNVRFINCIC